MPSAVIQQIFHHCHILVKNSLTTPLNFDEEGLSTLAPLHQKCFFQGKLYSYLHQSPLHIFVLVAEMRRTLHAHLLCTGMLNDLLEVTRDEGKQRILNSLDFPMGHISPLPLPQFRQVSLVSSV